MTKAAVLAILFLVPHVGAAITAAEFVEQGMKAVASSHKAAELARVHLSTLMARYPDMHFGVKIESTKITSDVLPIYLVRLDALQAFTNRSVATDVLTPTGRAYWRVYYPPATSVDHRVTLSSVELKTTTAVGGWQTVRMGGASYAESVSAAIEKADRPKDVILVQIPALALHFIGFVRDGQLQLSLIAGAPGIEVKERQAERAEDVLLKLVSAAKSHNGRST